MPKLKPNNTQFNGEINATLMRDFKIKLLNNDDDRTEVLNHLVILYIQTEGGMKNLPKLEAYIPDE